MPINSDQDQRLYEIKHKDEINLEQIFQFINRKKKTLGITILSFLLVAILYNMISTPIYESYVVAKKEETSDSRDGDQLKKMLRGLITRRFVKLLLGCVLATGLERLFQNIQRQC